MSVRVGEGLLQFTALFIQVFIVDLIYAAPILLTLILSISGIGLVIARIEGWSTTNGLYHAFINATTVGYGDFHPTRTASKFLSVVMALIGLIVTGLIVACAVHAANSAFTRVVPQSISGPYSVSRTIASDSRLGSKTASAHLLTPMSGQAGALFRLLVSKGHDDIDQSAVLKVFDPTAQL